MFRHLYDRDHLDQVIATFGIILFLNQGVKVVWGAAPLSLPIPEMFSGIGAARRRPALSGVAACHHRRRGLRWRCMLYVLVSPHPGRHAGARRGDQCRAWCRRSASISAACS